MAIAICSKSQDPGPCNCADSLGYMEVRVLPRYLASLLYRVTLQDLPSYAAPALLLLAAITIASLIRARRASRTDSLRNLRWE